MAFDTELTLKHLQAYPDMAQMASELLVRWEQAQRERDAFWEDVRADQKAEYINGRGIFHSPVLNRHAYANREITRSMMRFLDKKPIGDYFVEKVMCRFETNDYEPDIIFYLNEKLKKLTPTTLIHPIPDFIIEILSPSTESNDRGIKLEDYASHHVPEYWIVDPDKRQVEQYLLPHPKAAKYEMARFMRQFGVMPSEVIKGWSIEIETLWQEGEVASPPAGV